MSRSFTVMLSALTILSGTTVRAQPKPTETLIHGGVDHGFLVAPDFKFTDVDGDFATLAGGYGGWVIQRRLLLGGGVYTLTSGSNPTAMTYGGGVVEYLVNPSSLINVSLRGLVGGGTATVGGGFRQPRGFPFGGRLFRRTQDLDVAGANITSVDTSFFVAEPEANVIVNISERFRLGLGGGYRFIGGANGLGNRLDGFVASAALKVSFF